MTQLEKQSKFNALLHAYIIRDVFSLVNVKQLFCMQNPCLHTLLIIYLSPSTQTSAADYWTLLLFSCIYKLLILLLCVFSQSLSIYPSMHTFNHPHSYKKTYLIFLSQLQPKNKSHTYTATYLTCWLLNIPKYERKVLDKNPTLKKWTNWSNSHNIHFSET